MEQDKHKRNLKLMLGLDLALISYLFYVFYAYMKYGPMGHMFCPPSQGIAECLPTIGTQLESIRLFVMPYAVALIVLSGFLYWKGKNWAFEANLILVLLMALFSVVVLFV